MTPFSKVIAALTTAATSAAGFAAYKLFWDVGNWPFGKSLKGTLLSLEGSRDQAIWQTRFSKIKSNKSSLSTSLLAVANKSGASWTDMQAWCRDNIKEKESTKEEKLADNVKRYCTFNIGDKLTNEIESSFGESDDKWKKAHEKLVASTDKISDPTLLAVKNTVNTSNAGNKAIKAWCTAAYESPYKLGDETFRNAEKFCIRLS
ncbi:hypothetical protein HF1_05990 [Mycoplasma haemofelis str. Langford 1]|uniref:Lipoprotein n=1 Tax=Mycoplasma haemofelis (strain Langford 1) TaxID=941640 RepID=E8ZHI6_MYCHL|nr:hypothetical protein [Mycoplasma haemofelis]CBY92607.1 hypothetical protein HF1_05990 [Mycoplasma haemofelis str. Langford 1]